MDLYRLIHTSSEIKTIAEYCLQLNHPAFSYSAAPGELLKIIGEDGITNKQRLSDTYVKKDNKVWNGPIAETPIEPGQIIYIPTKKVNSTSLLSEGFKVQSNNINAFKSEKLLQLEYDEKYIRIEDQFSQSYPDCTVWIYSKVLGKIFNVTPFLTNVNTTNGKNGGNFEFDLPPLTCEVEIVGQEIKYIIKKGEYHDYKYGDYDGDDKVKAYLSESSLFDKNGNLSTFLFHTIFSANDMVWIRFETLKNEKYQTELNESLIIDKQSIAGNIYDMIGLLDAVPISITSSSRGADVSVKIRGRCFSKTLIDDGTYFYALENAQGQLKLVGNSEKDNQALQRLYSDNSLVALSLYMNPSIEYILKFVLQHLSNIEIVPGELFSSYKDRVNKTYSDNSNGKILLSREVELLRIKDTLKSTLVKWKRSRYQGLDESQEKPLVEQDFSDFLSLVQQGRTQNAFIINQGEILDYNSFTFNSERISKDNPPQFLITRNYCYKYEDITFVDIDNKYYFECLSYASKYLDVEASKKNIEKDVPQEVIAKGIWQIIKLVIDESVTSRRIIDSSMSSANGSLLNFIRKACQEPFVEFYMDTYGDEFFLVVRRPPTDKSGILSNLLGDFQLSKDRTLEKKDISHTIIDIEQKDVLKEELDYNNQEIYSWYHIVPQNSFLGDSSVYSMAYTPAVFFKEYANIWGSKPLQLAHNYAPYIPLMNLQDRSLAKFEEQAIYDLIYMIESNAYKPFTRMGTVTVNGDRRFKIGNFVRLKSTGEIFRILQVSQNFVSSDTIERTTTLTLIDGMLEEYIYGLDIPELGLTNVSYFNIVNTDLEIKKKSFKRTIQVPIEKKIKREIPPSEIPTPSTNDQVYQQSGGRMYFRIPSQRAKMKSPQLLADIEKVAKMTGIVIEITFATDGRHATDSRHYRGLAADLSNLNGVTYRANPRKFTPLAEKVATAFEALGYTRNLGEGKYNRAVLFGRGYSGHHNHIHVSNRGNEASSYGAVSSISSNSEWEYITEYESKEISYMGIDVDSIYSNLKVNPEIFNFFLKRGQFGYRKDPIRKRSYKQKFDDAETEIAEVILKGKKKS